MQNYPTRMFVYYYLMNDNTKSIKESLIPNLTYFFTAVLYV